MLERPNILLILIDQFRADLLDGRLAGAAGLKHLSSIADECCAFRRHFSVSSPCGPSRVSLFTGQYAMNHRAIRNGTPLRHDTPNLAREMQAAGYDPLLFGYTDATQDPRVLEADDPRLSSYEELLPGFIEMVRMRQESDDAEWRDSLRAKGYDVPDGKCLYRPGGDHITAPARYSAADSDTAFLTSRFIECMESRPSGWFAALTYVRPHPPFVAPAPYNHMYDPANIPPPIQADDGRPHAFIETLRRTNGPASSVEGFAELGETPKLVQQLRALYLGLAAEVDHHVGRLVAWLKDTGRWDSTIFILTSDHGEMLGDHGVWGKSSFHDASFHVPLLIRMPGVAPCRIGGMTESVDIAPTILDLAGLPAPHSMNGVSLCPMMRSGAGGKRTTFSEHDFGNPVIPTPLQRELGLSAPEASYAVLRTDTHHLVHFTARLPQILYDMTNAGEARDISASPDSQEICLDLSRQMLCHRMLHPESMFARTMVTRDGVRTGPT